MHSHGNVTVTAHIPDQLSQALSAAYGDVSVAVIEGFAVEAYRQGTLSLAQVSELLGHSSRWQTEEFLAVHQAWPGTTVAEVQSDLAAIRSMTR
jgi:hypothetical protein